MADLKDYFNDKELRASAERQLKRGTVLRNPKVKYPDGTVKPRRFVLTGHLPELDVWAALYFYTQKVADPHSETTSFGLQQKIVPI